MNRFISILQFLTRIPIRIDTGFDEDFHKSLVYFPLVGFIIGLITYIFGIGATSVFDPFVSAIVIVFIEVLITGGLHIDGLGDTFDALYSNRDKKRILEIMKDSRLGTNSLLAVLFLILLKIGFINNIINQGYLWVIIFMPVLGRIGVMVLTYKTVTPREQGMGNLFIGKCTIPMFIISILYSVLLMILLGKFVFLAQNKDIALVMSSIIFIMLFAHGFKRHVYKKIDGVTGDVLGCSIELSELVYLLYTYILLMLM